MVLRPFDMVESKQIVETIHQRAVKPHQPICQLVVVGLVVLLSAQLTGISCLEEWRIASLAGNSFEPSAISGVHTEFGRSADDGCPCHLAFVSFLLESSLPSCPVAPYERSGFFMAPAVPPFLLFHHPLSL